MNGSIAAIVTLGFGTFGSPGLVTTIGFGIGAAVVSVPRELYGSWGVPSVTGSWAVPSAAGSWGVPSVTGSWDSDDSD